MKKISFIQVKKSFFGIFKRKIVITNYLFEENSDLEITKGGIKINGQVIFCMYVFFGIIPSRT